MKNYRLLLLSVLLIPLFAFVEYEHPFISLLYKNLDLLNRRNPEEKLYVSTDKAFYKPNETIWLSVFVVNGTINKASQISNVVHIELIDPKGKLEKKITVTVKDGNAKGDFNLHETAAGGIYKIKAYTKYMRLLNPNKCFEKIIQVQSVLIPRILMKLDFDRKAYSSNDTVSANLSAKSIENKPLANCDFNYIAMLNGEKLISNSMQLNDSGCAKVQFILPQNLNSNDGLLNITIWHKGNTESISRYIPIVLNKIDLQFYPEGGYCVENVNTRVAFKAINEFGKPADIEGNLVDENNNVQGTFRSFHNGMGAFDFTPKNNKKYRAIITKPKNIETVYQFPEITPAGYVLNVLKENNQLNIRMYIPAKEKIHIVAQTKGVIQFSKTIEAQAGENLVDIAINGFPSGICQIALFNSNEQPVCSRLVFVNKQKLMNISITTDKQKYSPREKVTMKILTKDENNCPIAAHLALSVVDDKLFTFADSKQDNILSYLLLSSDVKGKIEEPDFYFKNNEPKADEALDYLLMTQGWSRFWWRNIVKKDISNMPDYTTLAEKLQICGTIVDERTNKTVKNAKVWMEFGKDTVRTDESGYFAIKNTQLRSNIYLSAETDSSILPIKYINGVSSYSDYNNKYLSGFVYDIETMEPLTNVDIQLIKNKEIACTGIDGLYNFQNIEYENDTIVFRKEGYKTKKNIMNGSIANCALEMQAKGIEIVKNQADAEKIEKQKISSKEVSKTEKNDEKFNIEETIYENDANINFTAPVIADELDDEEIETDNFMTIEEYEIVDEVVYEEQIYELFSIEEKPTFPGGVNQLIRFLVENTRYPQDAVENNIEGTVYIRFAIDKNGEVNDPKVLRNIYPSLEIEALRVVKSLPRWAPGKNNGRPVNTNFIVPIKFLLVDGTPNYATSGNKYKYLKVYTKSENINQLYEAQSFQACSYDENDNIRDDFRSTIYWNPDVITNEKGEAEISFYNSEEETTFIAIAEGISQNGLIGRNEFRYASQMSFAINAKIPVFLSFFDKVQIPVNIVNNTNEQITGDLTVVSPQNFQILKPIPSKITVKANSFRNIYLEYAVGSVEGQTNIQISFSSEKISDYIEKEIHVAPNGFPQMVCFSGNQKEKVYKMIIPTYIKGSLKVDFKAYTSLLSELVESLSGIIREPYGCFEQTSSSTYPNILALKLMNEAGVNDYNIRQTANNFIDMGYKRLIGFETPKKGYEWFGNVPPHEGLTAYGLMEFTDMKSVYNQVDDKMIERTTKWLLGRKDGKGGFINDQSQIHGWGNHTTIQNAYIVYALSESGNLDNRKELDKALIEAIKSKDAYRMALTANALLNYNEYKRAKEVLNILTEKIKTDGFENLKSEQSITYSWGNSLQIETCSLILLAMMKSENPDYGIINKGLQFILTKREYGMFGSTQSTILALKALCRYTKINTSTSNDEKLSLYKNNKEIAQFDYNSQMNKIFSKSKLAKQFGVGTFYIKISQTSEKTIPYSFNASWYTLLPNSNKECMIGITSKYNKPFAIVGETMRLSVNLTNKTEKGLPMCIAKIGIPSGLSIQPWQLKEMQEKKLFDYYEVDKNYLIVYYSTFSPKEQKQINLDLKVEVPGTYNCPASCAYLYYTDEFKSWCGGEKISVYKESSR